MSIEHKTEECEGLIKLHDRLHKEKCPIAYREYAIEYAWRMVDFYQKHGHSPFYSDLK